MGYYLHSDRKSATILFPFSHRDRRNRKKNPLSKPMSSLLLLEWTGQGLVGHSHELSVMQ